MKTWHTSKKAIAISLLAMVIIALIVMRIYLNVWLARYVNATLDNVNGYHGSIKSVDVDIYRGAYRIHELKLYKKEGKIQVPFLEIATADLSLQWLALFHGRIVSKVYLVRPVVNFAVNKEGTVSQTGVEIDWTRRIRDLMPIDINDVTVTDGEVTYKNFAAVPHVDINIHHIYGNVSNLRNVVDKTKPLPSKVEMEGDSIGGGVLRIQGRADILKPFPDFDIDAKLEKVDLPALNDYSDYYAGVTFNKGSLSIYSQLVVKDHQLSGYVKPIATDIGVIDLKRPTNPFQLAWESVVSGLLEIFKNHSHDQFATKVPLSGNLEHVQTGFWSTIGGIFHNAFIKAFDKKIDNDIKY